MHRTETDSDPRRWPFEEELGLATTMARLFGERAPARRLGRFALIERVGEGAMGQVWSAWDPQLDRRVALKLLHGGDDREDERVLREARMMASINHPNVAQIYEVESQTGGVFIAMEFVAGPTLREWQSRSTHDWREVLAMYAQAGRGLAAAHGAGVVHRDFKPDNVLVGDDGRVRVVDFGLADAREPLLATDASGAELVTARTLTRPRAGTPAYMAPEQFRGEGIDARTDQFAFCVALFEALTGHRPFEGTSSREQLELIERGAVSFERIPDGLPAQSRHALARGLQPLPSARFPSMNELIAGLLVESRWTKQRVAFGSVLVAALGTITFTLLSRADPCPAPDRLEPIWNTARRSEVRAALEQQGPSFVPASWPHLEKALDAYVDAWNVGYLDACRATHVRHAQSEALLDARMRCLAIRNNALAASVQTLLDADSTVAENAMKVVASLPPIERCADVDHVRAVAPPPDDPEVAREVERRRQQLAHAEAQLAAGRPDRESAMGGLEDVRLLGHAPLTAKALQVHGASLAALAEVDAAEPLLVEAYRLARAGGDSETAGAAAVDLAFLLARFTTRRDQARAWAVVGDVEGSLLDDVSRRAAALNAYGIAAMLSEDRDAAGEAFQGAVALLEGKTSPGLLGYRSNLARYHRHAGRIEVAAALFEEVVRDARSLLGPDHPALVGYIQGMTEAWQILGRATEAEVELQRALEIVVASRGEAHPDTTYILSALGAIKVRVNQLDEARALLERCVRVGEQLQTMGAQSGVAGLDTLAEVYMLLEQPDEALEHMRRNLEEQVRWMGPRSRDTAVARGKLATLLRQTDRLDEALAEIAHSIEIFEEVLGPEHLDLSQALQVRAEILGTRGRAEEAIADLERAIEIRGRALGPDSHKQADLYFALAEVQFAQGAFEAAISAGERVLELTVGHEDFLPHELAGVQFLVARALVATGRERERAATLARAAEASLEAGPPASRKGAAEVAAWLLETGLDRAGRK